MAKGKWLNTELVITRHIDKPCVKLKYCPYGQLVEEYPLRDDGDADEALSCTYDNGALIQFGHDCPVHYHAEFVEDMMKVLRNSRPVCEGGDELE